jgi:hypothetical protein
MTSPPYIYEGARPIEGYPIIKNKKKPFTFYLQTLTLFSKPLLKQPGPANARSTQDAPYLTGSLPGRRILIQAIEAAHRSDQQRIPV